MANRNDVIGEIWAKGAPDVPVTPAPSVTYANSTMSAETIRRAWAYTEIVASNNTNEMLRRITILLIQLEKQGILSYSVLTDYGIGALVLGSDNVLYKALIANGPETGIVDPVGNPSTWYNAGATGVTSVDTTGLAIIVDPVGGPITGTGIIDVPIANKSEAEDGASLTKAMPPLRVRQAIHAAPVPTTEVKGVVEKSTPTENTGGVAENVYPDVVGVKLMVDTHGANLNFLKDLIDDTNPQLGGNLEGQGRDISEVNLKDYSEAHNNIGSIGGGTQDIDLILGNSVSATVDTSTTTFTFSNATAPGTNCGFTLVLENGGSQDVVWPASVKWSEAAIPILTESGTDILVFFTIDGGIGWHGALAIKDSR